MSVKKNPGTDLVQSNQVTKQFLLANLYCSVTSLPPADLQVYTKIFPMYSVLTTKKSNSPKAIKFFSCLSAHLMEEVERQSTLCF